MRATDTDTAADMRSVPVVAAALVAMLPLTAPLPFTVPAVPVPVTIPVLPVEAEGKKPMVQAEAEEEEPVRRCSSNNCLELIPSLLD